MLTVADVKKMSRAEKWRAMELIWESIEDEEPERDAPVWHREILAERMAKIERGEAKFISLAEARKRLARKRK